MGIRGVIFDLGWTLVGFQGDVEAALSQRAQDLGEFLRGNGLELDGEAVYGDYVGELGVLRQAGQELNYEYPARLAMLRALRRHASAPDAARLAADALAIIFESIIPRWELYPDTLETLAALRKSRYRLGCISNTNDGTHAWRIVGRHDLRSWLKPIYMSEEIGLRKPHPGPFEMVLGKWALTPQQVVMVGDTLNADVLGAQCSGMRGIWIDRGAVNPWSKNEESIGHIVPDATIRALSEVPGLLARGWARA
jgi:putative hydrolase of the HAD superfamily